MQDLPVWGAFLVNAATLAWTIWYVRRKADGEVVSKIYARIETLERDKAGDKWVLKIEERVDKVEDRSTRLESSLEKLPDVAVTHQLQISILELKAEVGVVAERLKPVAETSRRMQEWMLEREAQS